MSNKMIGKAVARLSKEMKQLRESMPPGVICMHVNETDMHQLLFAIAGPEKTSFSGGVYVLRITLPKDYPYSAPDFVMLTPNGRFAPGAKICTSFSAFHPESWSPAYTLTTLLLSFISFFTDEKSPAAGAITSSVHERQRLAKESVAWARKAGYSDRLKIFRHLKPGSQTQATLDAAVAARDGNLASAAAAAPPASSGAVPHVPTAASKGFQSAAAAASDVTEDIMDLTGSSQAPGGSTLPHARHGVSEKRTRGVGLIDLSDDVVLPPNQAKVAKATTELVDLT